MSSRPPGEDLDEFLAGLFGEQSPQPTIPSGTVSAPIPVSSLVPSNPVSQTVADATEQLFRQADDGAHCPCCGQWVKVYDRKLNRNMVTFLRSLAVKREQGWVSFKDCAFTSRDYPYVAFWGLAVTRAEEPDSSKKNSGYWQITQKGLDFLTGKITVPSHARVYNNTVVGWSDTTTTAVQAYGEVFDYAELMGKP